MKKRFTCVRSGYFFVAAALFFSSSSYGQCITTLESRENITSNAISVPGNKTEIISSSNLNQAYVNQGNGSKLTLNFSGNNKTYRNDTIRFVGNMTVSGISRGNNSLNNMVFVVTENSAISFQEIDINNSSNIKFINYGIMRFENRLTMATNTVFINKTASSVLTFKQFTNFANNSNTAVLYGNGGIINFMDGFQLQGNNKMCLTGGTQVVTTTMGNDVNNGIYVPYSFSACIKYTSSATLNNVLTNGPGMLSIAQNPGAANASNTANWGTSVVRVNSTGCNFILPVVLKHFDIVPDGKYITAKWTTSSEENLLRFEIERSVDGINFTKAGVTKATGNSNAAAVYAFKDLAKLQAMSYFYRLKIIDRDGKFTYSGTREINLRNSPGKLEVFAGPGNKNIAASFPAVTNTSVLILSDIMGKVIYRQSLAQGQTTSVIPLLNTVQGNYFLVLISGNKKESVHIVL